MRSWYESIVGWHGATAVLEYKGDAVDLLVEQTAIRYNTNVQNRDVDEVYPTFLHSEGYTDTDVYDYANVLDRVATRAACIAATRSVSQTSPSCQAVFHTGLGRGFDIGIKGKFILDRDSRQAGTREDNYLGSSRAARRG